jgi:hypothetical protein
LELNEDKIDWIQFSNNQNIIEYDYQHMQSHFLSTFGKELIEWQFHPKNQEKWNGWGWLY